MSFGNGLKTDGRTFLVLLLVMMLAGCSLFRPEVKPESEEERLAREADSSLQAVRGEPVPYNVEILVRGVDDDVADTLRSAMREGSELVRLHDTPPDSRIGVERRAIDDVDNARDLLSSRGYYDGSAWYRIDWDKKPAEIRLILRPGRQYLLGPSVIERTGGGKASIQSAGILADAPVNLAPFGAVEGEPALAEQVLSAVEAVPDWFKRRGFPLARVENTRYRLYPSRQTLDPLVLLDTGPFALYGPLQVEGVEQVKPSYIEKLVPWEQGETWNASQVEQFRQQLLQSGLFREVRIEPFFTDTTEAPVPGASASSDGAPVVRASTSNESGAEDGQSVSARPDSAVQVPSSSSGTAPSSPPASGISADTPQDPGQIASIPSLHEARRVPVHMVVRESPAKRTVLGLNYASDVGAGAQGFWEHRNLFGEGERLRLSSILAQDRQELVSSFVKPAFGMRNQNFVSDAYIRKEETDSYDMTAWYADAGLERRFSGRWVGSARVSVQGGRIKEDGLGWEPFSLLGVPLTLRRDGTDSLLNPTSGTRLQLAVTPYTGSYRGAFSLVRTQGDFSAYYAPLHNKDGSRSDRLVLAARYAVGGMFGSMGENVERIPGALRYYAGGGGSVRGYKYQSLGPRNAVGDPLGGLSFNTLSFEARIRLTEHFGIVPFVDAGMVYDTPWPRIGEDLCWATGLGFRYYTPIGPVRLDVAVPLDNRNDDQKTFQVYISIGQAF